MKRALLTLALLCPALPALAATALVGARVVTMEGAVHDPGVVVVSDDGRIEVVGDLASTTLPADLEQVDLSGLHLYPGLIALDTTLGLTEISAVRQSNDLNEVGDHNEGLRSWTSHNTDRELIAVARSNGITHAQVVPTGGTLRGQGALMALEGWTWEERVVQAPDGLHLGFPSMGLNLRPDADPSLSKQRERRDERVQELRDRIADARAYLAAVEAEGTPRHDRDLHLEAWGPVLSGERPLFVHATDRRQILAALGLARAEELRIVVVGGDDALAVADTLAAAQVPVVFQNAMGRPDDHEPVHHPFAVPGLLSAAGVEVAIARGSGGWNDALQRNLPFLAAMSAAHGLPHEDALRALTVVPARILGVEDRLGSIAVGKDASLVAVRGDLLDIRSPVERMWIGGVEVDLANRQTRLHERYRGRPAP